MVTMNIGRSALVAALALAGCNPPKNDARPCIVLVSIDSLRPDHLGCYGYKKPTSPTIDHTRAAVNTRAAVAGFPVAAGTDAAGFTVGAAETLAVTLPIPMQPLVGRRRGETSSRRLNT